MIEVDCWTCAGTGNMTLGGGRNNLKDRCTTCGGKGKIPARTGETAATSWPLAVPGAVEQTTVQERGVGTPHGMRLVPTPPASAETAIARAICRRENEAAICPRLDQDGYACAECAAEAGKIRQAIESVAVLSTWTAPPPTGAAVTTAASIQLGQARDQAWSPETSAAWRDVMAERLRQVEAEGWTPEHDDEHSGGQMALAAATYAVAATWDDEDRQPLRFGLFGSMFIRTLWPWAKEWWKPSTRRRDLVKAGALTLAEIERLDRAAARESSSEQPKGEPTICVCGEPIRDGDQVYTCESSGVVHAACLGPERECFHGADGEPLKPGDPIPAPWVYGAELSRAEELTLREAAERTARQRRYDEGQETYARLAAGSDVPLD